MVFSVGDIVQMKKTHPCGSAQWEVLRTGIDFRIKCCGCGHMVMLPRVKFEKNVKKIYRRQRIQKKNDTIKKAALPEHIRPKRCFF